MYYTQKYGWIAGDLDDESLQLWGVTETLEESRSWLVFAPSSERARRLAIDMSEDDLERVHRHYCGSDTHADYRPEPADVASAAREQARAARVQAAERAAARTPDAAVDPAASEDADAAVQTFRVYVRHTREDMIVVDARSAEEARARVAAMSVADIDDDAKNLGFTWDVTVGD